MVAVVLHSTNPDLVAADLMDQGFSTPVAAEATDPLLPAVREPSPAPPPPPPTTAAPTEAAKVAPAPSVHRPRPAGTGWLDVLGAAGIVAGIGVWTRKWVRSRQPAVAEVESRR